MTPPLIGITVDNRDGSSNHVNGEKYESNLAYSRAVAAAGGLPLLLPQEAELAAYYVNLCDGLLLTGGSDVRMEEFGVPAHPESRCMTPRRQKFELALLEALASKPRQPTLGICLGMQLMALHADGKLHQHLPDLLTDAEAVHQNNHRHSVILQTSASVMLNAPNGKETLSTQSLEVETVVSSHHQGVTDAGRLRVVATAPDGLIEAIDDPKRPYYLGVQWHPERGEGLLNVDLIQRFVESCAYLRE
ncbi:MAG: gamma-glutamyl-gamma-aminobutyrate hydrolase family protein [Planctomycetota bacterium]|nr:gamma-glutamyl-gamma-aminobutyrate hydrolase family protein [Planctomycetota bacterium]